MRKAQQNFRRVKLFSGCQTPAELFIVNPRNHTHGIHLVTFDFSFMIAGIHGHHTVTFAGILCCIACAENYKGISLMTGHTPPG